MTFDIRVINSTAYSIEDDKMRNDVLHLQRRQRPCSILVYEQTIVICVLYSGYTWSKITPPCLQSTLYTQSVTVPASLCLGE